MTHRAGVWLVAAGLHCGLASAQATSPSPGAAARPAAVPAADAKKAGLPPAKPVVPDGYRSPFADYRPYTPQDPLKPWRAANDEVREAGGHAGLMKGAHPGEAHGPKGGKP